MRAFFIRLCRRGRILPDFAPALFCLGLAAAGQVSADSSWPRDPSSAEISAAGAELIAEEQQIPPRPAEKYTLDAVFSGDFAPRRVSDVETVKLRKNGINSLLVKDTLAAG